MAALSAFLSGVVFALGLGIAGMTQPDKIIGFLDITGDWDPDLLLVMVGAIVVTALSFWRILGRARPVAAQKFGLPERRAIDARLVVGAALFGVGWGVGGLCPGPALVSLVTGAPSVWVFVFSMLVGMKLFQWLETSKTKATYPESRINSSLSNKRATGETSQVRNETYSGFDS